MTGRPNVTRHVCARAVRCYYYGGVVSSQPVRETLTRGLRLVAVEEPLSADIARACTYARFEASPTQSDAYDFERFLNNHTDLPEPRVYRYAQNKQRQYKYKLCRARFLFTTILLLLSNDVNIYVCI